MSEGYTAFVVVWPGKDGKILRSDHTNVRAARQKCVQKSKEFGFAQFADVQNSRIVEKYSYDKGEKGEIVKGSNEKISAPDPDGTYTKPDVNVATGEEEIPNPVDELPEPPTYQPDPEPVVKQKRRSSIKGVVSPRPIDTKPIDKIASRAKEVIKRLETGKIDEPKFDADAEALIETQSTSPEAIERSAKRKPVPANVEAIVKAFKPRQNTLRLKLIELMAAHVDEPVSCIDIGHTLYGDYKDQYLSPIKMVLKGMKVMIEKERLPYAIKEVRTNGEVAFTLAVN